MKAGRVNLLDGRPGVLRPGHPHANSNGYILEARAVIEDRLGRILDSDETVHHLNGDPSDNRAENLLLATRAAHGRLHGRKRAGRVSSRLQRRGRALRRLRREKELTLERVAAQIGRSICWVRSLELGLGRVTDARIDEAKQAIKDLAEGELT